MTDRYGRIFDIILLDIVMEDCLNLGDFEGYFRHVWRRWSLEMSYTVCWN